MSPPCEIVRYRPEHREPVLELQTALWSPDLARNLRYLEWKYVRSPWAVHPPRIWLALCGASVVGMRGFFESRWEVGSPPRVHSIPIADDFAIRAEDRNRGLVTQIMRAALAGLADAGFDFAFSLSAGDVTTLTSLTQGWKSALRYEAIVRCEDRPDWRRRARERMATAPFVWRWSRAAWLRSADERAPFRWLDAMGGLASGAVCEREPRAPAMAALIAQLGHDGRLRHVRSGEYLAWRFANPMHQYRFLYAGGERLDGYLVLSARVMGLHPTPRVSLVDLEGRDARTRAELLRTAVEAGRFAELAVWGATLQPGERALLRELGFEPHNSQRAARGWPCALVRSTRNRPAAEWALESRALLDPASWDLRMLYSMAG